MCVQSLPVWWPTMIPDKVSLGKTSSHRKQEIEFANLILGKIMNIT